MAVQERLLDVDRVRRRVRTMAVLKHSEGGALRRLIHRIAGRHKVGPVRPKIDIDYDALCDDAFKRYPKILKRLGE